MVVVVSLVILIVLCFFLPSYDTCAPSFRADFFVTKLLHLACVQTHIVSAIWSKYSKLKLNTFPFDLSSNTITIRRNQIKSKDVLI